MSTRIPQPPSSAPDAAPPAKVTFSGHSHTPTRRSSVSDPKPTRPRDDPSSSLSGRGKVSSFSRSSDLGSSSRKDSQVTTTTRNNDNQSSTRSKSSTSSGTGGGGGGGSGGGAVGVVRTAARASFALPSGRASILAANANSGAASGAVPTASSRIGLGIVKRPQQQQSATHDSSSSREPSTSSAGRAVLLSSETHDASSHDVQEMNDAAATAGKRGHGHRQDVAPLQGSLLSDRSPGDGADAGGFSPTHDPNAATLAGGPPSSFLSSFNTPPNPPAISGGGGAMGPAAATAARSGVGADASSSKDRQDRLGFKKLSQEEEDDKERFLESIGLGRKKSTSQPVSTAAVATAAPPSALPSTNAMKKGHPPGKKSSPQNETFEGVEDGDPTVDANAGGGGHGGEGDEPTPLDPSALNLSIETRREGHDESLMHLKSPDVKDPSASGNADGGPNAHASAQPIEQEALSLNRGVSLTVPHPTTGRRAQKEAPNFTCMMSASLPGGASAGHLETVCAGRANGDVVLWRVPSHATKLNASGTSVGAAAQAQALEAATRKAAGRSSSSMMTSPRGNQQGGSGAPVPKPPKRGSDGQPLLVSATAAAFRSSNDVVGGRAVARAQSDERQGLAHSSATIRAAAHAQIQALADAEALASVGVVGPLLLGSHRGAVSSMTMVSAAGVPLLLTGAADCAITMWDVGHAEPPQKGQRMVQSVPAHDATVTCLAAHCNAIISGSADGVVKIWMFDATRKHLLYPWMLLSQAFVIGAWVTELWASPHKASDSLQGEVLIGDSTGNITALRSIPGTGNEAAPATPVTISGAAATARPGGFHSLEAAGAQQTETPRTGAGGGDQDLTISSKQALSQSPADTDARSPQGKSSKGHGHKDDSSSPSGGVGGGQQPQQQQQHLICGFELMKQHRLSGGGGAGAARETPISSTTPQSSPLGQGDGGFGGANGRPAAKAMSGGQFSAQAPAHGVTRIVGIPRLNAVLLLSHGTHAELRDHIGFSILATIKHPNAAGRSGLLHATGSEDMGDPHGSGAPGSSSVQNAMSNTGQDDGQVGGGGEDALASAAIAGTGLGGDHGCSRPGVPTTASTTVSWSQNIAAAATSALSASRFVDAAWLNESDELMLVDLAGSVFIWSAKTTKLTFSSTRVASAGKVTAAVNGRNGWTWIANRDHIASVAIRRKKTLQKFKGHTGRVLTLVPLSPWCYGQHGHGGGTFGKCPVDTDAPVSYITAGEDNMICFWSESLVIRHQWTHATVIPGAKGSGATLKFIASKNSKGQSYGVGTTAAGTAAGIAQQRRSMAGAPGQSLTRRSSLTQRNTNSSSKSPRNGGANGRDDDSDDEAADVVSGKGARIIRDLMRRAEKEEEDEELQLIANAANVINANGGSGRRHGAAEISAFVLMAAAPWCVTGHENGALKFWPSTSSVTVREPPGGVPPGGGFASPAVSPANPDSFNFNGFSGMMSQSRARDGNTSTVGPQMPTTRHRRPFHISAHDNTISVVGEGRHRRALGRAGARSGDHSPSPDLGGILPLATSSELSAAEQQRLVTSWTYEKWAHVYTGSYDGHFSLWELPEEADLRVRRHARVRVTEGEILCALYDTLNKMYIVGSSDGVISTWLCDDLRPGLRFDKAPPMSIVSGFKTSADAVVSLLHEDTAHSPTGSSSQGNASTPAHGNNANAKTKTNNDQSRQSDGMGGMHLDGPTAHNHQNANTTNTPHHHQSINQQSASMLCFSTSDRIVGGGQSPSGVPLPSMPLSRLEDRTKKAQLHLEKLERRLNKAEQRVRRRLNAKMIRRHEREAQKYIGQSGTATPGSHGAHTPTPGHGDTRYQTGASSTTGTVAPSALMKHTQQLSGGFGASAVAGGGGGGSVAGFSMIAGTGHATPAGAMSVASTSMSATPQPQMMTSVSAKQMGLGQQSRSNPSGAGVRVGGEKKTGAKKPRAPLTAEDAFLKMASKSGVSVVGADSSSSSDNDDDDSYSSSSSSEDDQNQNTGDPFSRHLTHGRPGSSEAGRPFGGASTKSETGGIAGSVSGSPNRDGAARTLSMSRGSRGLSGAGEDEERRRRRQQEEEQDEEDAFFDFLFDSEEEDELLLRREHDTFLAATGRAHGAGVTCIALDANYLFTAAEEETVSLRSLAVKRSDGESHRSKNIGAGKALSVQERDALRIADDLRAKRRRQRQQRHRRNEARQADRQRVLSQWGGVAGTGGSAATPSAALSGAMSIGSMSAAGLPNHQNPQNQNANPSNNVNADATTPAGEVLTPAGAGVGGATTPEVLMPNPFSMLANALPRGAVVVRVWNAVTYDALPPLRHPRRADGVGDVQALLVLPDSGDVAAGTRTGLVVIFDVAKRVAVKEWQMSSEVSSLAYDRQERELVVALVEGALQRLPIDLMTSVITL